MGFGGGHRANPDMSKVRSDLFYLKGKPVISLVHVAWMFGLFAN